MAKFNMLISVNSYEDKNTSNNPQRNFFKWTSEIVGATASKPKSEEIILSPNETRTLFDGTRTLAQDLTTQYSLALKPLSANSYILKHVGGTAPLFRTPRATSADNTTQVTVTQNATLSTFTSTSGTMFSLISGGVIVGDNVVISGLFNISNKITAKIIAVTATSFSIENGSGVAEVITLVANSDIKIFSASGVQKGDSVRIFGGFSPATQATYEVTSVTSDEIEIFSPKALASEGPITTNSINVFYGNKNFVYVEADGKLLLNINSQAVGDIEPFIDGTNSQPAVFMRKSVMWNMSVTNDTIDTVKVFFVTIE